MSAHTERELKAKVRDVMEAMGRAVSVYQQIELQLKTLLPHVAGPHRETGDTFADWTRLLNSKTTLGPLMARLNESIQASDPAGFERYLGELVEHRNELVHHFYDLPFSRMQTAEECSAALAFISRRIQFALPLHQAMKAILAQFLVALGESILSDGKNNVALTRMKINDAKPPPI